MPTMRAVWNGRVIAESDQTIRLEGNHYFPPHHGPSRLLAGVVVTA
jgi:uncharacterized protein (DUF427 family)